MTNLTKATKQTCCGTYFKSRKPMPKDNLPQNPLIENGVEVIYVGAGYFSFTTKNTGLTYHASDHNRHFKVSHEDIDEITKNKAIIYKP